MAQNDYWTGTKEKAVDIVKEILDTEHACEIKILIEVDLDSVATVTYRVKRFAIPKKEDD